MVSDFDGKPKHLIKATGKEDSKRDPVSYQAKNEATVICSTPNEKQSKFTSIEKALKQVSIQSKN